jgi:hypothetical protein
MRSRRVGKFVCSLNLNAWTGGLGLGLLAAALICMLAAPARATNDIDKIVGANACAECHKDVAAVWKGTHHFSTFRDMPRSKAARDIARKLKIRRIKADALCLGCHFTQQKVRNRTRVTAGISCESCHGAGRDWIKVHSAFSGKTAKDRESKTEAAARWKKSEALGMIRPRALYRLAKNCYGCHVVPREKLVNIGGHAPGSAFELVSWSQGEVRHNLWYSKGKRNAPASVMRKRMMYLVGVAVEIETALRAVAVATQKKEYAIRMAHRANRSRKRMAAVARLLVGVPELRKIVQLSHSAGLKLNNHTALSAAADKIAAETLRLLAKYDGSAFAQLDKLIPDASQFKGKPVK